MLPTWPPDRTAPIHTTIPAPTPCFHTSAVAYVNEAGADPPIFHDYSSKAAARTSKLPSL